MQIDSLKLSHVDQWSPIIVNAKILKVPNICKHLRYYYSKPKTKDKQQ